MSNDCDSCGLDDAECKCYLHELQERIAFLEEGLDQLTNVVNAMSEYITTTSQDEFCANCKNELVACVCME